MHSLGNTVDAPVSSETLDIAKDLFWVGVVSTAVSIPIGLWAVPRFRDKAWITAALLTGAGYIVKHTMLSKKA